MLDKPTQSSSSDTQSQNLNQNVFPRKSQHGIQHRNHDSLLIRRPILVDVPAETLTSITAYLDPPTLLTLGRVSKYLSHHIKVDNTWRRAFANQFLGIGPENDLEDEKFYLLRRTERSWRHEFIARYRLRRRWERSRSVTTTHIPVHHLVHGMHLMPSHGLLTASLEYGIVARSLPLTGKLLSGYLDASGTRAGLGVGNPNAEFTPNISAYDMVSDGGTAKVVWGSRAGDVLFLSAPKTMEGSGRRSATDAKRCATSDNHEGVVLDAKWIDVALGCVITSGADGRVKLWDAKTAKCAWSSEPILASHIPDHCLKVAGSTIHNSVVAVFKSRDIHVWIGFDILGAESPSPTQEIIIKDPIRSSDQCYDADASHTITSLCVDSSAKIPTFLVAYENDSYFYHVSVDPITKAINITTFGDPQFGFLSTVVPYFRSSSSDPYSSLVLSGDYLGCVNFYSWDTESLSAIQGASTSSEMGVIPPFRKLEVFEDGAALSSISWNGIVLACGSVGGLTSVFDGTTLQHLRSFPSPMGKVRADRGPYTHLIAAAAAAATSQAGPNANNINQILQEQVQRQQREWEKVRQIVLGQDKDVIFVGVGDKVMAWKAGPIGKSSPGGVRGRNTSGVLHGKTRIGTSRFFGPKEMNQAILESWDILHDQSKSSARKGRAHGSAQAQRSGLASLGLNETEALEYVLMLSRDEATARARAEEEALTGASSSQSQPSSANDAEEGVFDTDIDFGSDDGSVHPSVLSTGVAYSASSGSASSLSSSSGRSSITTSPRVGRPIPHSSSRRSSVGSTRFSPSPSSLTNQKVQVSPSHRAEPLEAGPEWTESDIVQDNFEGDGSSGGTRLGIEDHYFPTLAEGTGSSGSEKKVLSEVSSIDKKGKTKKKAKDTKTHRKKAVDDNSVKVVNMQPAVTPPSIRASAWVTPLSKRLSTSPPIASSSGPSAQPPTNVWVPHSTPTDVSQASVPLLRSVVQPQAALSPGGNDMDEDLRFALELSLAEEMSRGENI